MGHLLNRWILGLLAVTCLACNPDEAVEEPAKSDPWEPVRGLVGEWVGSAEGQSGTGTVRRTYAFVLEDRYLHETNISTYPPQEKNQEGETHAHWSFVSYDRERKTLVLRQFHQEGFVNQYALNAAESGPGKLVFDSERFENLGSGWKARETYEIRGVDEFIETFELGAPGKALEVYSRNHFKRYKGERCADNETLSDMKKEYGILLLCAAAGTVAGADTVCQRALGPDWETFSPGDLVDRTPPEKVAAGIEWVCASALSLPTGPDSVVVRRLGMWCAVYNVIQVQARGGVEALASAVARVPALADLIPRDPEFRASDRDIGDSLASAEHTMLHYALARRLSSMAEADMQRNLLALSDETTRARRRSQAGSDR